MQTQWTEFQTIVAALFTAPYWLLAMLAALISGYVIRYLQRLPFVAKYAPTDAIPLICIFVCSSLTMYLATAAPANMPAGKWRATNLIIGAALGLAVTIAHKFIIKKIEDKFPSITGMIDVPDDLPATGGPQSPINKT